MTPSFLLVVAALLLAGYHLAKLAGLVFERPATAPRGPSVEPPAAPQVAEPDEPEAPPEHVACPGCGRTCGAGDRFCQGCGQAFSQRCESCGTDLEADARFCSRCGGSVA